ncbi:MAG TPA: hypothetical protein VHG52_09315 [Thermomicrobiales bacterium]|nr:hypothetical protein [Thermomicrobiales bacterium]
MTQGDHQIWDLWYPDAAAQGLPFARGRLAATDVLLVHAAPDTLDVVVRDDEGRVLVQGSGLVRTAERPMSRLAVRDGRIAREDLWPEDSDIGRPVILPGGEVGILLSWWNAEDGSEWRWRLEFYNHR